MHLLLQQYLGDLYVANVKEFDLERLKDACLQHKTDRYSKISSFAIQFWLSYLHYTLV